MRQPELNAFADANNLDKSRNLAIARELERLYSAFVAEPLPRTCNPILTASRGR